MKTARWGDVCRLQYGKALRNYDETPSEENQIRVFGTNGPIGWTCAPLSNGPGIIIGRKGAYRGVHFSPDPFFVIDTAYAAQVTGELDIRWAYYKLLTLDINRMDVGAAIPTTNRDEFYAAVLRYPSLDSQRRAAAILAAYDDLIENNVRRMALLEESARQLYREWFVRLRFPGYEHTRIVNCVPDGWERRGLAQCATFFSGGTPRKARDEFWEGDIPWVSSGELTEMRVSDTPLHITPEAAAQGSRLVPRETILAVVRGMSLAKEWRISLTSRQVTFNQDLKAIVAKPDVDPLFLFHSLEVQREQVRDRAGEASHGTKKLETAVLSSLSIMVASGPMQRLFRDYVGPMHDLWDNLHAQNRKLRAARDLLLPRLMSGEIAV